MKMLSDVVTLGQPGMATNEKTGIFEKGKPTVKCSDLCAQPPPSADACEVR